MTELGRGALSRATFTAVVGAVCLIGPHGSAQSQPMYLWSKQDQVLCPEDWAGAHERYAMFFVANACLLTYTASLKRVASKSVVRHAETACGASALGFVVLMIAGANLTHACEIAGQGATGFALWLVPLFVWSCMC